MKAADIHPDQALAESSVHADKRIYHTFERVHIFVLFLLFAAPIFLLITYNSGYGQDQLEYLVLGRSLTEGYPLYHWFPSKSVGIYAFVAVLYRLGVGFGHLSDSLVLTLIFLSMLVATYAVVRATATSIAALFASVFVALSAVFMEMTFLETESFVFLSGVLGYYLLLNRKHGEDYGAFLSGVAIGLGMAFKSVAAFYAIAAALYLVIVAFRTDRLRSCITHWLPSLAAGFLLSSAIPAAYFALMGRFNPYWRWSVTFPLFDYPSNTVYLPKLYSKLLFIHLIFLSAIVLSLRSSLRREIYSNGAAILALLLAMVSYLAIFKTQASHYCFPGAAFLSIFAAIVTARSLELYNNKHVPVLSHVVAYGFGVVSLTILSAWLYQPAALKRFFGIRDFSREEHETAERFQSLVPIDKHMLMTRPSEGARAYWLAHRYPPLPFILTDQRAIWFLRHNADVVTSSLDDPDLVLVGFKQNDSQLEDPGLGGSPDAPALWDPFFQHLKERFVPFMEEPDGETLWRRK